MLARASKTLPLLPLLVWAGLTAIQLIAAFVLLQQLASGGWIGSVAAPIWALWIAPAIAALVASLMWYRIAETWRWVLLLGALGAQASSFTLPLDLLMHDANRYEIGVSPILAMVPNTLGSIGVFLVLGAAAAGAWLFIASALRAAQRR